MKKKHKRKLTILDLPFLSILDERPKAGQFILLAWDIRGYCGYESTYWDKDDEHCKHAVAWFPLPENHVYSRRCAVVLKRRPNSSLPILRWSIHFTTVKEGQYINADKVPKVAHMCNNTLVNLS